MPHTWPTGQKRVNVAGTSQFRTGPIIDRRGRVSYLVLQADRGYSSAWRPKREGIAPTEGADGIAPRSCKATVPPRIRAGPRNLSGSPTPMTDDTNQTNPPAPQFDFSAYPQDSLFHERRDRRERRDPASSPPGPKSMARGEGVAERRQKKERRRRIDPTTFEKQYTDDEMEFMNAMQRFKELSGKTFPTYGDVLKVAVSIGYRRAVFEFDPLPDDELEGEPSVIIASIRDN
jgi:hypothetical protein